MRRLSGVLLLLGFVAMPLAAQGSRGTLTLSLDSAVQRALSLGEEMRSAHAGVLGAEGQIREAFAGALPQITGSLVYTRQFASIFSGAVGPDADTSGILKLFKNTPFGAANAWNFQIQATQLLFAGGKVGAGLAGARALRDRAADQEAETAADVAFAVTRAYWNAASAGRVADIAAANLAQARDHERQTRFLHQAGMRAEYDLLRAQVDAANQEPIVVSARSEQDLALRELRRLVNLPAEQPLILTDIVLDENATLPVVQDDSIAGLEGSGRAVLTAAAAGVRMQEQAVRIARADRWPMLSIATTFSEQAFPRGLMPATDQFRRGWSGEVKLSFPIFLGFRTSGTIARARADLARAEAERDQVREQVALDVAQARAEVRRTQSLLGARRETVRLAARTTYLANLRYSQGLANELEVSDARVLALRAQVNQVQATRDYLVALAQLQRAVGRPLPLMHLPLDQVAGMSPLNGKGP